MPERRDAYLSQMPHKRALRLYRAANLIWLALGIAAVVSSIGFLLDPHASATTTQLKRELSGPLDDIWQAGFGLGGVLLVAGVWLYHPKAEVIGHIFLSGGIAMYLLAIVVEIGFGVGIVSLFAIFVASLFRVYFLLVTTPRTEPQIP